MESGPHNERDQRQEDDQEDDQCDPLPDGMVGGDIVRPPRQQVAEPLGHPVARARQHVFIDAGQRAGLVGQVLREIVIAAKPGHRFLGEQIFAGARPLGDLDDLDLGVGDLPAREFTALAVRKVGVAGDVRQRRQLDPVEDLAQQRHVDERRRIVAERRHRAEIDRVTGAGERPVDHVAALPAPPGLDAEAEVLEKRVQRIARTGRVGGP